MRKSISLAFFGSSKYSLSVLERLYKNPDLEVGAVVTLPDRPKGRKKVLTPNPTKAGALRYKLPTFTFGSILQSTKLRKFPRVDLIVCAWFGKILPQKILALPKYGTLNVHPSLLPKYRGPSPAQSAILNGEKETGVSIFLMDEKVDHGPLLAQASTPIKKGETAADLYKKLFTLGGKILLATIPTFLKFAKNKTGPPHGCGQILTGDRPLKFDIFLPPKKQEHEEATYTRNLTRGNGKINWQKSDEEIERMVRAFYPWPGAWTTLGELITHLKPPAPPKLAKAALLKRVKIIKAHLDKNGKLRIDTLQIEGKKSISFREFGKGYL